MIVGNYGTGIALVSRVGESAHILHGAPYKSSNQSGPI